MATLDALEDRLRKAPDDRATWLAYAEALRAKGDARGDVIALGERLRAGERNATIEATYAERCRAARWPRGAPFPRMHYAVRFEQMFAELRAQPTIHVKTAKIVPATSNDVAVWRERAGASWPEGMTELYEEIASVELEYRFEGVKPNATPSGQISIPSLDLWDHAALSSELWFDEPADHPLHFIRPIDRFVPEAYAVLYLRPEGQPAEVAYHYCGEELVPTGLTYREWLELLFRSRGAIYWLELTIGPSRDTGWVAEVIARIARLFPDFDPDSMRPETDREEIDLA